MSSDYFVKVDGVEGESNKEKHEKEIDILSWSWGVSNPTTAATGGGAGAGKGVPADLTFTHMYDKASPNLAKRCADGTHIKEVKLTARKAGGGQKDYLVITMETVFITSVSMSGGAGSDMNESVSCAFKKIKFEYSVQDEKGELKPGPQFSWDIGTGAAKN